MPHIHHSDYYPFGLTFNSSERSGYTSNLNLYQSKEWQQDLGLDTYDFEVRMYDPVLGRTFQLDPHLENYYGLSPYSWTGNNPILMVDPTGMDWFVNPENGEVVFARGESEFQYEEDKLWSNIGGDDMFGDEVSEQMKDVDSYQMDAESSEDFMNEQGYEKGKEEIVEAAEIDQWTAEPGGTNHSTTRLDDKVLKTNVTYLKPENSGEYEKLGFTTESDGYTRTNITAIRRFGVEGQNWPKKMEVWNIKSTGRNKIEDATKKDNLSTGVKWGKLIIDLVKEFK